MSRRQDLVSGLIIKAQKLSGNFNELLQKTSCLLEDSDNLNRKFEDCCNIHEEQVLCNLVKYCNDGDRVNHLLENVKLKRTLDEYKQAIKLIMEKYKIHTERNSVISDVNLREGYIAKLQQVVDSLENRIKEMTAVMLYGVELDEQNSIENQRFIEQLTKENAEMRRKLQIYTDPNDLDYFEQALPTRSDSSTQSESSDTVDLDSISTSSMSSFATCFSYNHDEQSQDDSIKAAGNEVKEAVQSAE